MSVVRYLLEKANIKIKVAEEAVMEEPKFPLYSFLRLKDSNEIHIFPAVVVEGETLFPCREDVWSLCSKVNFADAEIIDEQLPYLRGEDVKNFRCLDENLARLCAAFLQNSGYEVCGTCVSRLYKTIK